MSWLSRNIIDPIASVFGDDDGAETGTVVSNPDPGQKGDGFFSSSGFYNSLLNAGASLAGVYFKQTGDKKLAEMAAAQRMKELEAAAKLKAGGGGGGGGSGAAMKIAKMNNLSALYQNYAAVMQRAAENQSGTALKTGELMQNPILARAGRL